MKVPIFHHVNLKTTRLQAMIDWYGLVVGMQVVHRAPVGAWLTNDTANHRLALLALPDYADDPNKQQHTGLHHTAFEYASLSDLYDTYGRLEAEGLFPRICLDHGMTTSLYYADPDGNLVELQADNFGDWSKSTQWMATSSEFAANPIGIAFDPASVFAAYRAGAAPEDLQRRVQAGEFPAPMPDMAPSNRQA